MSRGKVTDNRVLILADDLTGALDATAMLRAQGFGSMVVLDATELATASTDVVALTTETRHSADPAPALQRVAEQLPIDRFWYKKIDSTLRGNFGIEIATLLDYSAADATLVVSTLPAQGRGLRDGYLVVHGAVQTAHLPVILQQQTGRRIDHIALQTVHAGSSALKDALEQQLIRGAIFAVDAMTDDDLRTIAEAVATLDARLLLAGSAGLASWLPLAWHLVPQSVQDEQRTASSTPVLCVLGSPNIRTQAQIAALRREVATIELDPLDSKQAASIIPIATDLLAHGIDVALILAAQHDLHIETVASEMQLAVAQILGTVAGCIIESIAPGSLIVGGGDTAFALCQALGIRSIVLDGEAAPGLPLGRATTAAGHHLRIVTKAGGFGSEDALLRARNVLHGQ